MTIQIGWRGEVVDVKGNLPTVGEKAPDFTLTANDLSEIELSDFAGQNLVLNIFPSIDTPTCATSTRRFNEELANINDTTVLCVSADLPYAQKRFCGSEGLERVRTASTFRSTFSDDYGVTVFTGIRRGLTARMVVVIDAGGTVRHVELVKEVSTEPDYLAALAVL
ncbi:MAG: thiol peroxidase [Litorivicinaceae bacterium]|nr:MAG: thiol peroxidase [Litorivicinaceae bacterium]